MSNYYHLSVNVISRSSGRSAVACSAYRSGQLLRDERYGMTHDYSPRKGISDCGVVTPANAPDWTQDRETLWNTLESYERRKDAQLAREFIVGLPHQLTPEQRKELVEAFIEKELISKGVVADWAIHAPNRKGDERNFHAHIMATMRTVGAEGFEEKKDRSLNSRDQLKNWRTSWAGIQNEMFERLDLRDSDGKILTVEHRSFEAIGLDQEPTVHLGVHATAMERKGIQTELGDLNREIAIRNRDRGIRSYSNAKHQLDNDLSLDNSL